MKKGFEETAPEINLQNVPYFLKRLFSRINSVLSLLCRLSGSIVEHFNDTLVIPLYSVLACVLLQTLLIGDVTFLHKKFNDFHAAGSYGGADTCRINLRVSSYHLLDEWQGLTVLNGVGEGPRQTETAFVWVRAII